MQVTNCPDEKARPIPGWEDRYAITEKGQVWSSTTRIWLKHTFDGFGYPFVGLYRRGLHRQAYIHSLVLETFTGPCPEGCEASHLDDVPANCTWENLIWETHRENTNRRNTPRGENHHITKLTNQDVLTIRKLRKEGVPASHIASRYNMYITNIYDILNYKTWKHIV